MGRIAVGVLLLCLLTPSTSALGDDLRGCSTAPPVLQMVERLDGADRYEVSAAVSAATFPDPVPTVYVASGLTYADALSGSAVVGASGGPLLLLDGSDEAPPAVQGELKRLKPQRIVVLGGLASVSKPLAQSMLEFAPEVSRVEGADRYEVSAKIAGHYGDGNRVLYVASGEVFSDALSASAPAGFWYAPVLLVKRDELPASVVTALLRMEFLERIVIVGGPATVSESVQRELERFAPVERVFGHDRYSASAAASAHNYCPDRSVVYVASGEKFPDALSGSAAAVERNGPVLLVSHDAISPEVDAELRRLNPYRIVLLGGEATIDRSVELKLADYLRK
ncbi:cell wall-binding repeat-containing protein [Herbiconiux liangxiaofengii]|uniref:cell wall-binding repeat-containing protein n=1 Tax=Herbiconiux liangxiaofengii TaxID=3342795 RepID=UPI003CEF643E